MVSFGRKIVSENAGVAQATRPIGQRAAAMSDFGANGEIGRGRAVWGIVPLKQSEESTGRSYGWGGPPDQRTIARAYVFWFLGWLGSLHRFYCGDKTGALCQIGLVIGSLLIGEVYLPAGQIGVGIWFSWLMLDLFLIPRMMRKFRETVRSDAAHVFN